MPAIADCFTDKINKKTNASLMFACDYLHADVVDPNKFNLNSNSQDNRQVTE